MNQPLQKPKIALCISGQTRDINEGYGIQKLLEVISIFEDDWDVDLYGHTWSDHEDPSPMLLNRLTSYTSEDQSVIWDAITSPNNIVSNFDTQHWDQWFQTKQEWWDDPEYRAILDGTSDTSYIDFAKERIYGAVGQCWSAHRSFNLVKDNITSNKYQAVVRLRWDMNINWSQGRPQTEARIEIFKQQLYDWIHYKNDFADQDKEHYSNCLVANHMIVRDFNAPFFNDFCFVFRANDSDVIKHIVFSDVMQAFKNIFEKTQGGLPSAHTLWAHYLISQKLRITPILPDLFNSYGTAYKSNKKWRM